MLLINWTCVYENCVNIMYVVTDFTQEVDPKSNNVFLIQRLDTSKPKPLDIFQINDFSGGRRKSLKLLTVRNSAH